MKLYNLVSEAYTAAADNGIKLDKWSIEDITDDMISYDAEIEKFDYADVYKAVHQYRKEHPVK
jgi:hypothetical protein